MDTLEQVHNSIYQLPSALEKEKDSIYKSELDDELISESDMHNQRNKFMQKDKYESNRKSIQYTIPPQHKRAQSSNQVKRKSIFQQEE